MNAAAAACSATRKDGSPCAVRALPGGAACFAHRPEAAESRRKGGQHTAAVLRAEKALPPHLAFLQGQLTTLFADVKAGKVSPRSAEVMAKIVSVLIDLSKLAHERSDAADMSARLAALEALVPQRAGRGWQ